MENEKQAPGDEICAAITEDALNKRKEVGDSLDPVIEVNDESDPPEQSICQIADEPPPEMEFVENSPRIFGKKDNKEKMDIEALNNVIYELGIVNLAWPKIEEPVFETRTSFPVSYYQNTPKERLLLTYAENFRRQFSIHFKMRKPLLLQAPNECGLQKMVCTSIRPTKLCYAKTNTWQGIASLVSDFFDYEPLQKPMLHLGYGLSEGTVNHTEADGCKLIDYPTYDLMKSMGTQAIYHKALSVICLL